MFVEAGWISTASNPVFRRMDSIFRRDLVGFLVITSACVTFSGDIPKSSVTRIGYCNSRLMNKYSIEHEKTEKMAERPISEAVVNCGFQAISGKEKKVPSFKKSSPWFYASHKGVFGASRLIRSKATGPIECRFPYASSVSHSISAEGPGQCCVWFFKKKIQPESPVSTAPVKTCFEHVL